MRCPDCHSDHYLIEASLDLEIKLVSRKMSSMRKRRLNTSKLPGERCEERLQVEMTAALSGGPVGDVSPDR